MAINKNRHDESLSTVKAAKKGTQTLGKSSSNGKHDKFMSADKVAGGRETTDANEWKEARNASIIGHPTNKGGGGSSKSKDNTNANSSSTSSTSNNKEQSAPASKKKPSLADVKKKVKPQLSATELWRRTPQYKFSVEKAKINSEHAQRLGASQGGSINLMDVMVSKRAEELTLSDSRLKKLAKQYGVELNDVTDVNRDGLVNETDISIIANNQQANPREALSTGSVAPQEVEQEPEMSPANEVEQPQPEQEPDIFTQGADALRNYFGQ